MFAQVTGNLGRDAEIKYTPKGSAVLTMSVPDKVYANGEQKTQWVKVVVFGAQAERLEPYLKKGSGVSVSGELNLNEYVKKDGEKAASLELKAYDIKLIGGRSNQDRGQESRAPEPVKREQPQAKPVQNDFEDDIPF